MMQRHRTCILIGASTHDPADPLQRDLSLLLWFQGHIEPPSLPLGSSIKASRLFIAPKY